MAWTILVAQTLTLFFKTNNVFSCLTECGMSFHTSSAADESLSLTV